MKKTFKILTLTFITFSFFFIGSCGSGNDESKQVTGDSTNTENKSATLAAEITLSLCANVVDVDDADSNYARVYSTFFVDSQSNPIGVLRDTLHQNHLDSLNAYIVNNHSHTCSGFVPGLKVFFGLENTNIRLLYQAVCYCKTGTNTFSITPTSTTYSVYTTASGFTEASASQESSMAYYMSHLKIKEGGSLRSFDTSNTQTGDTKAVLLTFQGLKAVMTQNSRDKIIIWNYIANVSTSTNPTRHTMIVSADNLSPNFLKGLSKKERSTLWFLGKFADRSHLCPPSCTEVQLVEATPSQPDCQQ